MNTKFGENKQKTLQTKWKAGLFIMQPDTVLTGGGITLIAPVLPNVQTTATKA